MENPCIRNDDTFRNRVEVVLVQMFCEMRSWLVVDLKLDCGAALFLALRGAVLVHLGILSITLTVLFRFRFPRSGAGALTLRDLSNQSVRLMKGY